MDNRIQTIRKIQSLVECPSEDIDEILWIKEEGYDDNFWFNFIYKGKSYALYLQGECFCANVDYTLYLCDSVDDGSVIGEKHLIHDFFNHYTSEAKMFAEQWLLDFMKCPEKYRDVTYREIFLHADPWKVQDIACRNVVEVEIDGKLIAIRAEEFFEVCKGLNLFAKGERFEEDEQNAVEEILASPGKFPSTRAQARVFYAGIKSAMKVAFEALDLSIRHYTIDECVSDWLDNAVFVNEDADVNMIAAGEIENILKAKRINE